jgi:hypothetical protein
VGVITSSKIPVGDQLQPTQHESLL